MVTKRFLNVKKMDLSKKELRHRKAQKATYWEFSKTPRPLPSYNKQRIMKTFPAVKKNYFD